MVEDVYMLRCIWQSLNSLSIHVTFTAIVPGAYPGESKMWLNKKDGYRQQNVRQRQKLISIIDYDVCSSMTFY